MDIEADQQRENEGTIDDSSSGCWSRFLWDLRVAPLFSINEPNARTIHVASSFAGLPTSSTTKGWLRQKWCLILYRSIVLMWVISTLALYIISFGDYSWIFMGYVTNWAFIFSIASLLSSWTCTVWSKTFCEQPQDSVINTHADCTTTLATPKLFVKVTWVLFSVAAVLEILVTILYWSLLRDNHTYTTVLTHGIIAFLILVDGFIVGRIPIRFKHFIFVFLVAVLYVCWSLLQSFLNMGTGTYRGANDDPLYVFINWSEEPITSMIVVLLILFIGCPLVYTFVWMLSVLGSHRCGQGCCVQLDGSRRLLYPLGNNVEENAVNNISQ